MDKLVSFTKNTTLAAFGLLALFVGFGAIAVVFGATSWQVLGDWTLKAVIIAAIIVVISAISGFIVSVATPKSNK